MNKYLRSFVKEVSIYKRYTKIYRVSVLTAICLLATVPALADVENLRGKAVNSDGELAFIEEHTIRFENNQIASMSTIYYDAELNKIGELVTEFSPGSQVSSYEFKDERLQYKDGARVMPEKILIYCKETPGADLQKKYLQRESGQIVGQGFHPFIQENLNDLLKGEVFSAKLVLPAQMDQFNVRIYKENLENGRLRVRIEMDNWFLRLFAPHVDAVYDIHSRKLLSYQGLSPIANASGKTVPVTVSYEYPTQPVLANSLRDAESEPVVPD